MQRSRRRAVGLPVAIADDLYISSHTVRNHVKAIFRKVQVSSRGELVAKLFAEHDEPDHLRGTTSAWMTEARPPPY